MIWAEMCECSFPYSEISNSSESQLSKYDIFIFRGWMDIS